MATIVLIIGQSGTGKSTSLRNFSPDDVSIVNVSGKPLPFKGKLQTANTDDYMKIDAYIHKTPKKSIVIDDFTYLMVNEFMRNAKVTGYQKFTDLALNFHSLVKSAAALPDDVIVYFLGHSEIGEDGRTKAKTIGKMIDEKICLEGLFTVVLKTVVQDGKYFFSTQNNGSDTVKSPMGMFDSPLIENDLKAVDEAIRKYYA